VVERISLLTHHPPLPDKWRWKKKRGIIGVIMRNAYFPPIESFGNIIFFVMLVALISACAASQQTEKKTEAVLSAKELPRSVAVLPFGNETDEIDLSGQVRKSFSNYFSSKPYNKIEPHIVDEKVALLEKATGKTIFEISPKEVAEAFGVDGLIYGKVTDFNKVYALAYSQIGVEAEIWMVNAKTGEEIWQRELTREFEAEPTEYGYSESKADLLRINIFNK